MAFARQPVQLSQGQIESGIKAVQDSTELTEPDKQTALQMLQRAADDHKLAEKLKTEAQAYSLAANGARDERRRIASELAAFEPRTLTQSMQSLPLEDLEARFFDLKSELASIRSQLTQLQEATQTERTLALQSQIDEARKAAAAAPGSLSNRLDTQAQELAVQIARLASEQLQQARLSALEQQLITRPARLAVMEDRQALLSKQLVDLEGFTTTIQALLNQRRKLNAEGLVDRLAKQLSALEAAPLPLRDLAQQNIELAQRLTVLLAERHRAERDLSSYDGALSALNTKVASLDRLLALQQFESSASFGVALRRERDAARQGIDVSTTREVAESSLTSSRVALFEIEERQPPYSSPVEPVIPTGVDVSASWAEATKSVLKAREKLLADLSTNHRRHVEELLTLLDLLVRVSDRSLAYRDLLDSHLFWIPSTEPFGLQSVNAATNSLEWILMPSHWNQVRQGIARNLKSNTLQFVLGALILIAAVVGRKALKHRLIGMEPLIGKVRTDQFSLTLIALGITALLALPVPLIFFGIADLTAAPSGFASGLSAALFTAGATLLFMEFFLQLARPKGVAQVHFRWRAATLTLVRRIDRWLISVLIPTIMVMVLLALQATPEIRDGLGRLTLVLLCLTIAAATYQLSKTAHEADGQASSRLRAIGYPVLIATMLALIALSLLGYHYTSTQLLARVIQSLFVVAGALLVYYILDRASNVYERRLALERLVAKRAAAAAQNAERELAESSGEVMPEIIDSQEIDRHTISNQTTAVLRMLVWIGLILALAAVWRDLLPVGRSLNDWVVWQVSSDNPALQPQDITLWSLIVALSVLLVSFVAVKNLPGVLEVAILSRLKLAPGGGYAITTVVKYAIVIIGAFVTTNLLGADWSKLQWLVAALGVGLGFGLQEIVANFVSGIIILFERPFRLGDTVTIGGQTGTVTKIQTRATTIIDWDRKELIIPNKSFVTNDFINWTLSDATTRLIVPVGIAYGSDVQAALETLQSVARRSPKVLDEPAPAALFLGFGDSALNFELRVFTRSIGDRLLLTHELHLAIEKSFREQEIEISYPQRDVHLSASKPLEVTIKPEQAP